MSSLSIPSQIAMKKRISALILAITLTTQIHATTPKTTTDAFYFVAMNFSADHNENTIKKAFSKLSRIHPAFAILNGIKSETESCNDELFLERKYLTNTLSHPVIISVSSSDWTTCKNSKGESIAIERLTRFKEIFFETTQSLGNTPLELTRQSFTNRFSNYPENVYWHKNAILFATIHIPSDNNHYITAAGRNNEFEERSIANQHWLDRLFRIAQRYHYKGIVLISDGNPFSSSTGHGQNTIPQDGFRNIRQKLNSLISRYPGRVLFIYGHGVAAPVDIAWKGRLGTLGLHPEWTRININPHAPFLFKAEPAFPKTPRTKKKPAH